MSTKPIKELLYVPPEERFLKKILTLPPVTVVLDLEDGTPPEKQLQARENIITFLESKGKELRDRIFVRINTASPKDYMVDHLMLYMKPFRGYVLPKINNQEQVKTLITVLTAHESDDFEFIPTIETAEGVLNAQQILSSSTKITAVQFGREDFMNDMGTYLLKNAETRIPRMMVSMSAHACGVTAIDSPWPGIVPSKEMKAYYDESANLGYEGCGLIHPDQIDLAKAAYGPGPKQERALLVSKAGNKLYGPDRVMYGPPAKKACKAFEKSIKES